MNIFKEFTKGFVKENPTFVLVLGMCPTLATTTSLKNAIGMGLAATFVLVCSNMIISMIKNVTPNNIRIPIYVVVIAAFVSIVDMVMAAYTPPLYKALGIFIPLIVVNCIILGRAEAFAGKYGFFPSTADGLGMGIGFTLALSVMAIIRELLGTGQIYGMNIMPKAYLSNPMLAAVLVPGAFFTLGFLMALVKLLKKQES
jgi:Na+-translocating ferredoxin:NAD+ oxidoreductase subunit E